MSINVSGYTGCIQGLGIGPSGTNPNYSLPMGTGATGYVIVSNGPNSQCIWGANGAGSTGPTGPAGNNGSAGATGPTGANGNNGSAGATGPTGANGSAGSAGATGATGATGPSASLTPYVYTAYGSSSQVVNGGTYSVNFENNVLNTFPSSTISYSTGVFTYIGSGTVYWLVTYSIYGLTSASSNFYAGWIIASTGTVEYGLCAQNATGSNALYFTGSAIVAMNNNSTMSIKILTQGNFTISTNATTQNSNVSICQLH